VTGSRYLDLFKLGSTDYKGWAHGLKKAGYATDPKYPELLIRKIDEYGLHEYDDGLVRTTASQAAATTVPKQTAGQLPPPPVQKAADTVQVPPEIQEPIKVISLNTGRRIQENNNVQFVIVKEGDTYESLAEEFQLLSWEISRYNDLSPNAALRPGQVIYLQPKRNKAADGNSVHVVQTGETMYFLSQKYAVKLSYLYKMNVMEEGTECIPGQKVRVR
jgi:LysM repeat protein